MNMKKRRLIAVVLSLCLIIALLAGCSNNTSTNNGDNTTPNNTSDNNTGSNTSNNAENNGGTSDNAQNATEAGTYLRDKMVISAQSDGGTLDPFASSSQWGSAAMTTLVFQHLANIDSDGTLYYEIAKSFEKVDDTHYTLTIWDCVYDSEGNSITADDVIWSFDQMINTGNIGAINKFDHFEKIDDYTLTWVCNAPFTVGELEKNLSNCNIVCQATYEAHGSDMTTAPVGSGPYKLKDYTVGSTVVLEADEDFWMVKNGIELSKWDLQNVKELEYQIIQDASSRAIALEMGTIDLADSLDAADVDAFASNPDITPVLQPQDPPIAYLYNCSDDSPFADVNLRKAVAYALDNDAIAEALAVPAYAVYAVAPRMWDAPDEWLDGRDYYNYDPEKAAECLAESSYNGESLKLMYTSSTAVDGAVIMIQQQLKEVGINVELLNLDMTITMLYQYETDQWDFRLITLGGGNYTPQVLKWFWSGEVTAHFDNNETLMMVPDAKLDALYEAVLADNSEENINAWDDYFTYEMCYGYGICCYSNQTACRTGINIVMGGSQNTPLPNASTFDA